MLSILIGWNRTALFNDSLIQKSYDTYEWSSIFKEDDKIFENFGYDAAWKGFISLTLTIVNIICIIVMGVVILRIKEVTPDKIPQRFSSFWQQHVRTHRNYTRSQQRSVKNRKRPEHENTLTLLQEVRNVLNVEDSEDDGLEDTFLQTIFEQARNDKDYLDILRATGKPAPIKQPWASFHRQRSRRCTEANNNEGRSLDILDTMRDSKLFESRGDIATSFSNNFTRSTSNEPNNTKNGKLYMQAKIIKRSRSIGTGLSRRGRHKRSKKLKQVKIDNERPIEHEQFPATCLKSSMINEEDILEKTPTPITDESKTIKDEKDLKDLNVSETSL